MAGRRLQQLDAFERAVLSPATELARVSDGTYTEKAVNTATLFEALLWLRIGVRNGIYPVDNAPPLLESAYSILQTSEAAFKWWYLFPDSKAFLSGHVRSWLLSEGEPRTEEASRIENRFAMSTLVLGELISNVSAQTLISALVFADNIRWRRLLERKPPLSIVAQCLASKEYDPWFDGYAILVYAGCIGVIRHLEVLLELFADSIAGSTQDGNLTLLRLSIADAHGWRFYFTNPVYEERFKAIMHHMGDLLSQELPHGGIEITSNDFDAYIRNLIVRWQEFTEPNVLKARM